MRILTLLLLLFFPLTAAANDSEYGNVAGSPAPVENTQIRMVSEDILIEEKDTGFWQVKAVYVFENTTKTKVKLTMGFPEILGDEGKPFLKFVTRVRDQPVKVRRAKSAPFAKTLGKGAALGRVHLFEVEFAAGEKLVVQHDYEMEGGGSVAIAIEKTVSYVTRTGALWAGPIGRATFTLRTREVHDLIAWSPDFQFKSLKRIVLQKGETTGMELVLENTNWTPKADLDVDFMTDEGLLRSKATGGDCPSVRTTDYRKFESAVGAEKEQYLEVSDLSKFDAERLRLCRNHIYARYGYTFSDPNLNKRFYGEVHLGKYPPIAEQIEELEGVDRMLAPLMPDPGFSPGMLSVQELFYIKALRAEERRRRDAK